MGDLQRRLTAFLGGLGVPVYLRGWVPARAVRPYMTFAPETARPLEKGRLTLRYYAAREGGNAARAAWMAALGRLIPPAGTVLAGVCLLRPETERLTGGPGTPEGPAAEAVLTLTRLA